MKRFKNIAVVYNDLPGSDDALTQATALAVANGAKLTLIDVVPTGSQVSDWIAEREKRLRRTIRSLSLEGIESADCVVVVDDGHQEVIRQVHRSGHDMVIVSSETSGSLASTFHGSLASALTRRCSCPVWVVKPGQSQIYRRVLAAVDIMPGATEPDPLSAKIVEMASSLAATHGAELHVLHAWEVTGRDADTLSSEVPDATRERLLEKHESSRRRVLQTLVERHNRGQVDPVQHLPRGTPEQAIRNTVAAERIDLIIMGTQSRASLLRLLFGDTAEVVLAASRCGVMTVKPDGFEAFASSDHARDVA